MPPVLVTISCGSFTFCRAFSWRQVGAFVLLVMMQCGAC